MKYHTDDKINQKPKNRTFCTKQVRTQSFTADKLPCTPFSPYLAASPSISYFTVGKWNKARRMGLSVCCSLLKNISCLSSIRWDWQRLIEKLWLHYAPYCVVLRSYDDFLLLQSLSFQFQLSALLVEIYEYLYAIYVAFFYFWKTLGKKVKM